MVLPININELIHGSTVEWERIELKEGWHSEVKPADTSVHGTKLLSCKSVLIQVATNYDRL